MMRASILPVAMLLVAGAAHAADVPAALAPLRSQIEASDYRATGQLVQVEANGARVSYAISIKGLWFQGAMHTLVNIASRKGDAALARQDERVSILLEMSPNGAESIRIFRPHRAEPTVLPFEKWDEGLMGTALNYEDLLDPQYFWPGQVILRTVVLGARQCEVLKSTPGPSDSTHYSEVRTWLDRTIHYPVYAEKVMKQGGAVKEFTSYGIRRSGGIWTATQVEVKVRGRAGSTILMIKRGSTKANLSSRDFTSAQIGQFEDRP